MRLTAIFEKGPKFSFASGARPSSGQERTGWWIYTNNNREFHDKSSELSATFFRFVFP